MDVVVVGNGIAGNTVAETILSVDLQAKVTIISDEPLPEYSACVLCDYISGALPKQRVFLKSKKDYSALGIKTLFGRKIEVFDPFRKRIVVGNRDHPYDKLILATGSEPILPPIKGVEKKGVFCLKTLSNAEAILKHNGKKAVVVGSGPIGIEATAALQKKGYEIHLVEILGWILPKLLDQRCSVIAADVLGKNGVDVIVGERVNEFAVERASRGYQQIAIRSPVTQ